MGLVGLWSSLRTFLIEFRADKSGEFWARPQHLWTLVAVGYLAFIVKFTLDYRDFASMKVIYLLPGVLAFCMVFANGLQMVLGELRTNTRRSIALTVSLCALLLCYVWGSCELVLHLIFSVK